MIRHPETSADAMAGGAFPALKNPAFLASF
jgi:hypothetical protein